MSVPRITVLSALLVLTLLAAAGCAGQPVEIHEGMTAQTIVERVGEPDERRIEDGRDVWIYTSREVKDVPEVEYTEQGRTIRLDFEEPGATDTEDRPGPYRMLLKLSFSDNGLVRTLDYSVVQRDLRLPQI